jgi:hypothetical protein
MTLSAGFRLKQEQLEPRLVRKQGATPQDPKPRLRESVNRPWMLNRGC